MPDLIIEGIDLSKGIEGHPELTCIAIVLDGVVIPLPQGDIQREAGEQVWMQEAPPA